MYTTLRSSKEKHADSVSYGGVDLLERKTVEEPAEVVEKVVKPVDNTDVDRARMRENLDKLLNYDRRSEIETADVKEETVMELKTDLSEIVAITEDDIRPTSTTMQFGNDGKETVFKDMEREKEGEKYKLNGKGKALVFLYALVVVAVLTLIILNTGILSVLSGLKTAKAETLAEKKEEVSALYEKIEQVSSDEHVIEIAEAELNMIRG